MIKNINFILNRILFIALLYLPNLQYGQIVFTDVNPDYVLPYLGINSVSTTTLDIDHNGTVDYELQRNPAYNVTRIIIVPKNGNKFVCISGGRPDTLNLGNTISSSSTFCSANGYLMNYDFFYHSGDTLWKSRVNKFIGLSFNTPSGTNYGWIRMKNDITISGYAYNSVSNQPIAAGEGSKNVAENIVLSDNSNNGDGRDLRIKFEPALEELKIWEYRLLVVPDANASGFTEDSAKHVPVANSFTLQPHYSNIDTLFNQFSKDVYGNTIHSLVPYKAFVMSYPNPSYSQDTLMSFGSNAVTLTNPVATVTQPTVTSTFLSANAYNLNVKFNVAVSESGILHYRVYFMENQDSVTFNLDSANSVLPSNYYIASPTGTIQNLNFNSVSVNTFRGQAFKPFTIYRIKVMAYTDSVNSNYSSLSLASNSFTTYTQVEPVKTIMVEDIDDSHDISDIKVSFKKAANENNISEYRAIIVPKASVNSFTLDSANSIPYYVSFIPNGSDQSVRLTSSVKDFKGNGVIEADTYYFFVLSVHNGANADVNSLCTASKYFAYSTPDYFSVEQPLKSNLYYHEIPDTTFAGIWHSTDAYYYMDIDSNGVNDLKFRSSGSTSAGGASYANSIVYPLNNTQFDFTSATSNLVINHDSLDMIYSDMNWKSTSGYLKYYDSYMIPGTGYLNSSGGLWGSEKKYLALRLIAQDTIYAWVKLSVQNTYSITVYSYGLQKKNMVGINEIQTNETSVNIWPNPATDHINFSETINKISVMSNLGIVLIEKINSDIVDVSKLPPGIYFVHLQTQAGYLKKKIVVSR